MWKLNSITYLKVTWWPCCSLLILRHHFLPVMTMPNKETAKIAVKMRKFKFFHFLLKFDLDIEVKVKCSYCHNMSFASSFPNHQTGCWILIKWLRYRDLCENDRDLNFKVTASISQTFSAQAERLFHAIHESIKQV